MGGLPEFGFLSKEPNLENRFVGRLRLMAQNQNIQIRYTQAIERKAKEIAYEDPFAKHNTNFWLGYRPCMGVLDASWTPQHIIDPSKVNKVVVAKYDNFMADLRATLSNVSSKLLDNLNTIISKENPSVSFGKVNKLGNSCCLTPIREGHPNGYFDFIFHSEPQMKNLVDNLRDLDNLKFSLIKESPLLNIISDTELPLSPSPKSKGTITLLGTLLGFFFSCIIIYLINLYKEFNS